MSESATHQADKIQALISENEMRANTYYKIIRKYRKLHEFEDVMPPHVQKLMRDIEAEANYLLNDLIIRINRDL